MLLIWLFTAKWEARYGKFTKVTKIFSSQKKTFLSFSVEFIYTNKETDRVQLGHTFSPTEDYICVSMYLLMCDSCKVKLTLLDASNGEVIEQDFNQLVVSHVKLILD
jgi:hypothetical protein